MPTNNGERILRDCFIKLLDPPAEVLHFVTTPIITSDSVTAQYKNTPIPRSTTPRLFWMHTTGRIVSIKTEFFVDTNYKTDVFDKVNWCRALQYPLVVDQRSNLNRPPICMLVIGKLLAMRAIISQVTPDYDMSAFDINSYYPVRVGVSIQFEQIKVDPEISYSFSDIASGKA